MTDKSDNNPSSKRTEMRQLDAKELMEVSGGVSLGNWINPLTRQFDSAKARAELDNLVVSEKHMAFARDLVGGINPSDPAPSDPAAG